MNHGLPHHFRLPQAPSRRAIDLFVQVLRLCRAAGLVQFGHVAVDGTKLKANASRHKAMSYGRMKMVEPAFGGRGRKMAEPGG